MNTRRRQQGMTFISLAAIVAMVAFLAMIALKLLPIYLEDFSVSTSIKSLKGEAGKSPQELRAALMRRLDINDVDNVASEDIVIERDGGIYRVIVDYQVRTSFIHNVDFVVTFNHNVEVPSS